MTGSAGVIYQGPHLMREVAAPARPHPERSHLNDGIDHGGVQEAPISFTAYGQEICWYLPWPIRFCGAVRERRRTAAFYVFHLLNTYSFPPLGVS